MFMYLSQRVSKFIYISLESSLKNILMDLCDARYIFKVQTERPLFKLHMN